MSEIDPQEFGKLQAQVAALMAADAEKRQLLHDLQLGVTAIREIVVEARGGWKILVGIGTAVATLGASIYELLSHIKGWLGN